MDILNQYQTGKSLVLNSFLVITGLSIINIFIKTGINKKSLSEFISVLITSFITSLIIWIICKCVNLNIYKDLISKFDGVKNVQNIVASLYIIITLGIFMDIISIINYDLNEKKDKAVDIPWKTQFFEGMEIGKKYIFEKINIIIFILLSVSLFPIAMNINKGMSFAEICKQPQIFTYLIMAIVGGIGAIISVPITSFTYSCLNRKKTIYKTVSENKLDGKRSLKL